MPVYVYKCQKSKCGAQNLSRVPLDQPQPTKCSVCRKGDLKRVFTAPAIIIK